jgi:hypothetical protein
LNEVRASQVPFLRRSKQQEDDSIRNWLRYIKIRELVVDEVVETESLQLPISAATRIFFLTHEAPVGPMIGPSNISQVGLFPPTPQLFPFVNRLGHGGNRPERCALPVEQWDAKTVIYVKLAVGQARWLIGSWCFGRNRPTFLGGPSGGGSLDATHSIHERCSTTCCRDC